jgi:hypothetical protein
MAITKTNGTVETLKVRGSVITAVVRHELSDDSTDPATIINHMRVPVTVTNASSAELAAAQSLVTKAIALAVA